MRKRNRVLVLWSVLLAVSLVGCNGCGEEPANESEDDKSEVMQELEKKGERARAGEAVDFDGDGHKEYRQWMDEKGVRHIDINGPPHNPYRYVSETQTDGTEVILYDDNGNGRIDHRTEKRPNSLIHFVDHDGDGIFDERVSNTFDYKNNKNHRVFEKSKPDGSWEKTLEKTEPINRETPFPAEMKAVPEAKTVSAPQESLLSSFDELQCATSSNDFYRNVGNRVRIKSTGSGACNSSQRNKIKTAFDKIFSESSKALRCLAETNPQVKSLLDRIAADPFPIDIDCALVSEDAAYANRSGDCTDPANQCSISINKEIFRNNVSDTTFMSVMLHEYIHLLGYDHPPQEQGQGTDAIYSCGRYCGGCANPLNIPAQNHIDCARCSNSTSRKMDCGYKEETKFVPCSETDYKGLALCHCNFNHRICVTCKAKVRFDCGGNSIESNNSSRALCCESCPDDASCKIDMSCAEGYGGGTVLTNTCFQPPPFCR